MQELFDCRSFDTTWHWVVSKYLKGIQYRFPALVMSIKCFLTIKKIYLNHLRSHAVTDFWSNQVCPEFRNCETHHIHVRRFVATIQYI